MVHEGPPKRGNGVGQMPPEAFESRFGGSHDARTTIGAEATKKLNNMNFVLTSCLIVFRDSAMQEPNALVAESANQVHHSILSTGKESKWSSAIVGRADKQAASVISLFACSILTETS